MNFKKMAHVWLVAFGLVLVLQFFLVAPTFTPEDLLVTVPLLAAYGVEGYMTVFAVSLGLAVLGVFIILCVSKHLLKKYLP